MKNTLVVLFVLFIHFSHAQEMTLDWQSCYGSFNYGGDNNFYALEKMPNGNIIGCVNVDGNHPAFTNYHDITDAWVIVLDTNRALLTERCFGGSLPDIFVDIEVFEDYIYFYGNTNSTDGDAQSPQIDVTDDLWVVKTDFDLNIIWERKYGNVGPIQPKSAKVTPSGGLVFVADFFEQGGGDVSYFYGSHDIWVCNVNADGNIIWEVTLGNQNRDEVGDVLVKENGNVVVLGETNGVGGMIECNFHPGSQSWYRDYWIIELDENGEIIWQQCYGGSRHEQGFDIIEDENGYTILGFTISADGDVSGNHGLNNTKDYWLIHIDSIGNLEWQKCFGGSDSEVGFSLFKTNDNGYVLIGIARSDDGDVTHNHCWPSGFCNPDVWVVVADSNRNILWENTYGGLSNGGMQQNSTVKLGEMDFLITSAMDNYYVHEGFTADFDCTPYPVEENVSAWIFRLRETTIGSNIIERNYKSLSIFPNPANDKVLLELPERHQNIEIQIFDMLGQEVTSLKAIPQQTQVLWDVRYILSGVYFYQTEIAGVVYRGKIVVN